MHAAWMNHGGKEFVPGRPKAGPGARGPMGMMGPGAGAPLGAMVGPPNFPGLMPMPGRWPGQVGPMGHAWAPGMHGMPGGPIPPEAQWLPPGQMRPMDPSYGMALGAGPMPGPTPPGAGPSPPAPPALEVSAPKTPVLLWNLSHSYTQRELERDLIEIDFLPEKMLPCDQAVPGAYVLWYREGVLANALVVSLDGTAGHLRDKGEPIRLAKWIHDRSKWSSDDVPPQLQQLGAARIQQENCNQHIVV